MPKLKKLLPWFGGMLIGLLLSALLVGIYVLRSISDAFFDIQPDPAYELVAVSWGTRMETTNLWLYQIQVIANDQNKDGILEVSAKGCIGSSSYFHDFGPLGTATSMGEAVEMFGTIKWETDEVTIGGANGVKASVKRSQLERHH
jgi:hypothetical protein